MQLIVDSEAALVIKRDMSAIEDVHNEKVVNGDIEQLIEKNCNGNKINIADNVIANDEKKKQSLPNLPFDVNPDNSKEDSSIEVESKGETCESRIPESNCEQKQDCQSNGIDKEIQSTEPIIESEEKSGETAEEEILEDEEDIISLKHEDFDQILDTAETQLVKVRPEADEIKISEDLPVTKNNVEKPAETKMTIQSTPYVELEEAVPEVNLEGSANEDNSSDDKDISKESSKNNKNTIETEVPERDSTEGLFKKNAQDPAPIEVNDDMDVEEVKEINKSEEQNTALEPKEKPVSTNQSILCKLSNTLDILSDDEDDPPKEEIPKLENIQEKQCINIEDDDDIMLIDEDTNKTETQTPQPVDIIKKEDTPIKPEDNTDSETGEVKVEETNDLFTKTEEKAVTQPDDIKNDSLQIKVGEKQEDGPTESSSSELPLLPNNFLKSAKKNLSDMTRDELEEFCILKIVESIVDRSNLSEIKNKLKTVAQGVDEYRKKVTMLTKQNRDLQVVLKSIQEEQKKSLPGTPITPLKITRSVGMQVFMEKTGARRKNLAQLQTPNNPRPGTKSLPNTNVRPQKPPAPTQSIPVPRLVPASPAMKSPSAIPLVNQITPTKPATPIPNGIKNLSPVQKAAEKRQHNRIMSVTVDLTDDEPPSKMNNRTSPAPPVRVVPSQNLMANPRQPFPAAVSSPRKVYIPISGPQNQNIRPGQAIMLKTVPNPGIRPRGPGPQAVRQPTGPVRMNRTQANRHPAPLPDAMKQYQPPNWKALPPAPDLKLSKVENGIVISWKIEGYQEDSYEEIASYQLYAYQETSSPPSTSLWKKIGDVKALPLPMACTLTQFMAGFKYFFAVRAVDIRSRLGPFSVPGSILLLNKL